MRRCATELESPILANQEAGPRIFRLRLRNSSIAEAAQPGQFLHLRIEQSLDPFLRRPFSVHRAFPEAGELEVLYRLAGRGTDLLSRKRPGETVNCIGPLGNGFGPLKEGKSPLMVAGGMGVAPLIFLAERCFRDRPDALFLLGASSRSCILYERELKDWGVRVEVSTDDGSWGSPGPVTDLLAHHLEPSSKIQLYACGPPAMQARVAEMALEHEIACQLSLENWMGCGMGACLGCAIPLRSPGPSRYKRVCADGPVFDAREVMLTWGT